MEPGARATTQTLLDGSTALRPELDTYRLFPVNELIGAHIGRGYDRLAEVLATQSVVTLDGFGGVRWDVTRRGLERALHDRGIVARWVDVSDAMRDVQAFADETLFVGDALFGRVSARCLEAFFHLERLSAVRPQAGVLNILYGCGSSLAGWAGLLVYFDVPKNEIQYRARARAVSNLGLSSPLPAKEAYRRSYYLDWPALTRHRAAIAERIDWFVDAQDDAAPSLAPGDAVRESLARCGRGVFRARPWFESGAWGGQWLKRKIVDVGQEAVNYAWSFEMITPENGIVLSDGTDALEVSFDLLMALAGADILGAHALEWGSYFPIRINLLDTIEGGNLSVQCHPAAATIAADFGEPIAQDETYYILEHAPGAKVYLGLRMDVDVAALRAALEASAADGTPVPVEDYVASHLAAKGDLFLIPHGTVHSAGAGNLVLEISSTPYLYTFKMYDWVREDLDGSRRPLNISRAFASLDMDDPDLPRAQPSVSAIGEGWRRVHLPTTKQHRHDVARLELRGDADVKTDGSPLACNIAEGGPVHVVAGGIARTYNRLETFCVAAAARSVRFTNLGDGEAHVMLAWLKPPAE